MVAEFYAMLLLASDCSSVAYFYLERIFTRRKWSRNWSFQMTDSRKCRRRGNSLSHLTRGVGWSQIANMISARRMRICYRDLLPGNGVAQFGELIEKALKKKWRLIEKLFNHLWALSGIRYPPRDAITHGRSSPASTTTSNDGWRSRSRSESNCTMGFHIQHQLHLARHFMALLEDSPSREGDTP